MGLLLFPVLFSFALWQTTVADSGDLLMKSLGRGDFEMAETLLVAGANPNAQDRYGQTALCRALIAGETRAVELLLRYKADPNAALNGGRDANRFSPLQYAARTENISMASRLIRAGADLNAKGSPGRTALQLAAADSRLEMMRFLIQAGADVNARDAEGATALDDAAWRGALDGVAILVARGAHLNEGDTQTGATPINEAAFQGHTEVIRFLLHFNPDLSIVDKQGFGPLENAVRRGREDAALLLIEAEGKPYDLGLFEKAMDVAATKNEAMVVDSLLRHGTSVDGDLPSGYTPLEAAAFTGSDKVVRILLDYKADPNRSGRNGSNPLESASLKGFSAAVEMLVDGGASINQISAGSGTTALYTAASFGKGEVVAWLLDRGAKPNLCGENRKTAHRAALENGFSEIAAQIQTHGGSDRCEP